MVHHHEEHVLLGGASPQRDTQDRRGPQLERASCLGVELGQQLLLGAALRLMQREGDGRGLVNLLSGNALVLVIGGAQHRVPVDELLPCAPEGLVLEGPLEPQHEGKVVGRALGIEPMQMPERLLTHGLRMDAAMSLGCSAQDALQRQGRGGLKWPQFRAWSEDARPSRCTVLSNCRGISTQRYQSW